MDTRQVVIDYESAEDRLALIASDYEAKRQAIMAQVKAELDALAEEFAPLMAAATDSRDAAKATAVDAVRAVGETVKGARLMMVWCKPRETWDTKALAGYAAAHPEIERFKKNSHGQDGVAVAPVVQEKHAAKRTGVVRRGFAGQNGSGGWA